MGCGHRKCVRSCSVASLDTGRGVFDLVLDWADKIELTEVHAEVAGDAMVPAPDPTIWRETNRQWYPAEGDAPAYSFVTLERR